MAEYSSSKEEQYLGDQLEISLGIHSEMIFHQEGESIIKRTLPTN